MAIVNINKAGWNLVSGETGNNDSNIFRVSAYTQKQLPSDFTITGMAGGSTIIKGGVFEGRLAPIATVTEDTSVALPYFPFYQISFSGNTGTVFVDLFVQHA